MLSVSVMATFIISDYHNHSPCMEKGMEEKQEMMHDNMADGE